MQQIKILLKKKMHKIILLSLIISLFINKLSFLPCPEGTETNVSGVDDDQGNPANCVNCQPDYYFNGDNFIPGVSECEECQISKAEGTQANPGGIATLALQCDINCPAGTQTENGETVYVAQKQECNFCKADHYNIFDKDDFEPGDYFCEECSIKKTSGSQATIGFEAQIEKQCNIACPTGTTTETAETNYKIHENECINCNVNFYFDSNEFLDGVSTCKPCPVKKIIGAVRTQVQCDVQCPDGTVVKDGKTTFENEKSECVKCAPNFYTAKQEEWIAGIDICFPCSNILIQGAQANYPSVATQATQCRGTFSQFLTFSLLFIYLYFL
ncbi:immobilization antigen isoform, putative [Ichthyophthirius multifiliis]|uniref:Immobilization antigen isoform, putative n=1 Tax=Ichthyophthirius multifiliis TaxID=5932 RepID=G0QT85_ICHMU|nr:immobilization antigen isoform, putative [Ichthyophthirius multifiliis]EGR31569.1 immobilization antigen isoform, putative [Ichthyophthirius multifiliis]|eukprot:XP_004035055.1 immobilization antigen isoform, putative [Ichthyophthirius multifiliis]